MSNHLSGNMRKVIVGLADAIIIAFSLELALFTRFDFHMAAVPAEYISNWHMHIILRIGITLILFAVFRMYRYVWHMLGVRDVALMLLTTIFSCLAAMVISRLAGCRAPVSVEIIAFIYQVLLLMLARCFMRVLTVIKAYIKSGKLNKNSEKIMVIGAGRAGSLLLAEMYDSGRKLGRVCCIVDDDHMKWGRRIENVPIVGGHDRIPELVKEYGITQIIFAIPSATPEEKREILNLCKDTGCKVRKLPGMYQIVTGEAHIAEIQDVQPEDLLGRDPVSLNTQALVSFLQNKAVLVTGGGGSIGSELCRQIATFKPEKLIILDCYENNAYSIQQELKRAYGDKLNLHVEIASVRDKARIYDIFAKYRPNVVFHAAAHKHVPLMEDCPSEAIKNNIFGTYHVVCAAEKFGTDNFVMISSDKAVNPTNVMGASKRFCEMILQSRIEGKTKFCAVRFGNVLGSNGSVIPLFKKQIASGGPVTITDKRIIRYFMTISEASQLVMEAGAMAQSGQIFVLDMGEPVKILDLAENLIRLSGLEPYKDIEIREIGLRPGEKLYEELLMSSMGLGKTENRKIFVEQQDEIPSEQIRSYLEQLDMALTEKCSDKELTELLHSFIPTYGYMEEVNAQAIARMKESAAV